MMDQRGALGLLVGHRCFHSNGHGDQVVPFGADDARAGAQRALAAGAYEPREVVATSSPSMDIQVSSKWPYC